MTLFEITATSYRFGMAFSSVSVVTNSLLLRRMLKRL